MNGTLKITLLVGGFLAAALILSQVALALLILSGRNELRTAHQHSGYMMAAVSLLYVFGSLVAIAGTPTRPKT